MIEKFYALVVLMMGDRRLLNRKYPQLAFEYQLQ